MPPPRIHVLDISSLRGPFSPNTFRTRLALFHKCLPYSESSVPCADISSTLESLDVPHLPISPTAPAHTLPTILVPHNTKIPEAIRAHTTDSRKNHCKVIVGSLPIARFLDSLITTKPAKIFFLHPDSLNIVREVQRHISNAVVAARPLVLPLVSRILDERSAEYFIRSRQEWFNLPQDSRGGLDAMLPRTPTAIEEQWQAIDAACAPLNALAEASRASYYTSILWDAFIAWFERVGVPSWERLVYSHTPPENPKNDKSMEAWGFVRPTLEAKGLEMSLKDVLREFSES